MSDKASPSAYQILAFLPFILSSAQAGEATKKDISFDESIENVRQQYSLPALAYAWVGSQGAVQFNAFGVRKQDDPRKTSVRPADRFHLGSCTKAMTATVLAVLIEKGLLTWETQLGDIYRDEFSSGQFHPAFQNVTLSMLGAHRSGITGNIHLFNGGQTWSKLWNPALSPQIGRVEFTREILGTQPESTPGTHFEYSNANQMILGAIMERITGKPWESLMKTHLFEPMKMTSCGFGAQASEDLNRGTDPVPSEPWPHIQTGENGDRVAIRPDFFADNPPTLGPAGTVHCSMQDWGKFAQLHLQGAQGKDTEVLKAQSFPRLHTPLEGQDYTPGGWIRLEREWANGMVLTHSGSNSFNFATVWIAPNLDSKASRKMGTETIEAGNTGGQTPKVSQSFEGISFLGATNLGGPSAEDAANETIEILLKELE